VTEFITAMLAMAAGVFAGSAAAKLRSRAAYRGFVTGLRDTRLIPGRLLKPGAATLAAAESACAIALVSAVALRLAWPAEAAGPTLAALAVAVALAAVLAAGVATVLRRGTIARCACFGAGAGRPLGAAHLVRNLCLLALLAAALAGLALAPARWAPTGPPLASPALTGPGLAAAAGLVIAVLLIRWDDLAYLLAPLPVNRQPPRPDPPAHIPPPAPRARSYARGWRNHGHTTL
jgi:hypothetical protein